MSRDMQALLLLLFAAGFYLLAAAGAAGLAYAALLYLRFGFLHVALVLALGAAALAYGLVPWPREESVPPGVPLDAMEQPRLFAEISAIAAEARVPPPEDVYLDWGPEAWVQDRGGILGFGGRRTMLLGYPLLCALTVSELRAIVAHEMGHFRGDTRLAGVVHRVHASMARTLESLQASSVGGFLLAMPFYLYALLFVRLACAVSRAREADADALAARIAGSDAAVRAIQRASDLPLALPIYGRVVSSALDAGWLPDMGGGVAAFLATPRIAARVRDARRTSRELPYDTHPPVHERIRALGALDEAGSGECADGAGTLLDDTETLERRLVATIVPVDRADALRRVTWQEALADVLPARWRAIVEENARPLGRVTIEGLPELARDPASFDSQPVVRGGYIVPPDEVPELARVAVGAALSLPLLQRGWSVRADPGGGVLLVHGDRAFEPFEVLPRLRDGLLTPGELAELASREQLGAGHLAALGRT